MGVFEREEEEWRGKGRWSDDSEEVTEVRCVVFETTYQQFLL